MKQLIKKILASTKLETPITIPIVPIGKLLEIHTV